MNQEDLIDTIIPAISRGRYSLLLGSGFSASSRDTAGNNLPTGAKLGKALAKEFGLPDFYSLGRLSGAIKPDKLHSFLKRTFENATPSDALSILPEVVWKCIYSFNVDNLVEEVYKSHPSPYQKLSTRTYIDEFFIEKDLGSLQLVHLHGSIAEQHQKYVFSSEQYSKVTASGCSWFTVLADELYSQPFIVIGASLDESDLEHFLQLRNGIPFEEKQKTPSIYVANSIDQVVTSTCERHGLAIINSTGDEFLKLLKKKLGEAPRPLDLILKDQSHKYINSNSDSEEKEFRIFFRQWLRIIEDELPLSPEDEVNIHLLKGTEPRWDQLLNNQDIPRRTSEELVEEFTLWLNSKTKTTNTCLVTSPAGEGKTCILMRTALELSRRGFAVYFFNSEERILTKTTINVLAKLHPRPILIIDDATEHGRQISELLEQLETTKIPVFIILAERQQKIDLLDQAIDTSVCKSVKVKNLNSSEAERLARKLSVEGLLGKNAKSTNIPQRLRTDLFTGLITLSTAQNNLNSYLRSEIQDLDNEAKKLYLTVALAHSTGNIINKSLVGRATNLETQILTKKLRGPLSGLVRGIPPHGEFIETRHRVIAEKICDLIDTDEYYNLIVRLTTALAPYVNRFSMISGSSESRLAGALLDYDRSIKHRLKSRSSEFYKEIHSAWAWNSRYWEQRALLSLENHDLFTAHSFAQQAVGIEKHYVPLTTLCKVEFDIAKSNGACEEGWRSLRSALDNAELAIELTKAKKRRNFHTYDIALRGINAFLASPNTVSQAAADGAFIHRVENLYIGAAHSLKDTSIATMRHTFDALMSSSNR